LSASGSGRQAPLRVAVIAVGGMAHWQHLPNLRALRDQAQLVAMADVDSQRLAPAAATC
jgi:predicted dehydrogenase